MACDHVRWRGLGVAQFDNPYNTEDKRKTSPGEHAQVLASVAGALFSLVGVKLVPQETEALATVINGILRNYPQFREIGVDQEQPGN